MAEPAAPNQVGFPFDQRWGLHLWRGLFLDPPDTGPDQGRDAAWNRGRELVRGITHCGACHTDRNWLGARIAAARFKGSDDLPGGRRAPAITAPSLREKGWTAKNLALALKTGIMPDGDTFGAAMAEVVHEGTAFLTPADRAAIAAYLVAGEGGPAGE